MLHSQLIADRQPRWASRQCHINNTLIIQDYHISCFSDYDEPVQLDTKEPLRMPSNSNHKCRYLIELHPNPILGTMAAHCPILGSMVGEPQ